VHCNHYKSGYTHYEFANIKDKHADQLAKEKGDALLHPYVELPWL
jgi:hypothetical protein